MGSACQQLCSKSRKDNCSGEANTATALSGDKKRLTIRSPPPPHLQQLAQHQLEYKIGPFFLLSSSSSSAATPSNPLRWHSFLQSLLRSLNSQTKISLNIPSSSLIGPNHTLSPIILERLLQTKLATQRKFSKQLNQFIQLGDVPREHRWAAWKVKLNLKQFFREGLYDVLLTLPCACVKDIVKDISRAFPNEAYFRAEEISNDVHHDLHHVIESNAPPPRSIGQESLLRVLKAVSQYFPSFKYTQGMNLVAGFCLLVGGGVEEEAFWMFVSLARSRSFLIMGLYENCFPLIDVIKFIFDVKFRAIMPDLHRHIKCGLGIFYEEWLFQWALTLFLDKFALKHVLRFWDFLIAENNAILAFIRIALAVLRQLQPIIINADHGKFHEVFNGFKGGTEEQQQFHQLDEEKIINDAKKIKVTQAETAAMLEDYKRSNELFINQKSLRDNVYARNFTQAMQADDDGSFLKEIESKLLSEETIQQILEARDATMKASKAMKANQLDGSNNFPDTAIPQRRNDEIELCEVERPQLDDLQSEGRCQSEEEDSPRGRSLSEISNEIDRDSKNIPLSQLVASSRRLPARCPLPSTSSPGNRRGKTANRRHSSLSAATIKESHKRKTNDNRRRRRLQLLRCPEEDISNTRLKAVIQRNPNALQARRSSTEHNNFFFDSVPPPPGNTATNTTQPAVALVMNLDNIFSTNLIATPTINQPTSSLNSRLPKINSMQQINNTSRGRGLGGTPSLRVRKRLTTRTTKKDSLNPEAAAASDDDEKQLSIEKRSDSSKNIESSERWQEQQLITFPERDTNLQLTPLNNRCSHPFMMDEDDFNFCEADQREEESRLPKNTRQKQFSIQLSHRSRTKTQKFRLRNSRSSQTDEQKKSISANFNQLSITLQHSTSADVSDKQPHLAKKVIAPTAYSPTSNQSVSAVIPSTRFELIETLEEQDEGDTPYSSRSLQMEVVEEGGGRHSPLPEEVQQRHSSSSSADGSIKQALECQDDLYLPSQPTVHIVEPSIESPTAYKRREREECCNKSLGLGRDGLTEDKQQSLAMISELALHLFDNTSLQTGSPMKTVSQTELLLHSPINLFRYDDCRGLPPQACGGKQPMKSQNTPHSLSEIEETTRTSMYSKQSAKNNHSAATSPIFHNIAKQLGGSVSSTTVKDRKFYTPTGTPINNHIRLAAAKQELPLQKKYFSPAAATAHSLWSSPDRKQPPRKPQTTTAGKSKAILHTSASSAAVQSLNTATENIANRIPRRSHHLLLQKRLPSANNLREITEERESGGFWHRNVRAFEDITAAAVTAATAANRHQLTKTSQTRIKLKF